MHLIRAKPKYVIQGVSSATRHWRMKRPKAPATNMMRRNEPKVTNQAVSFCGSKSRITMDGNKEADGLVQLGHGVHLCNLHFHGPSGGVPDGALYVAPP